MTSAELELKAAKEDAIIENAEIIIYDMLTHLAEKMNAAHAIPVLTQSLSEERSMADWIRTKWSVFYNVVIFVFFVIDLDQCIRTSSMTLDLILRIWLYSYGLKLRLLLLRVKKNSM
ncbi:MAG: DUF892 family protein [Candidatus Nitrosopolaris sp.]